MSTTIETSAGVKSALTESVIADWLKGELAKLDTGGMDSPQLSIRSDGGNFAVTATGYTPVTQSHHCAFAGTIPEAWAKLRAEMPTGPERASQLREEAAKLLAEADAIEPEPQTVDLGNGVLNICGRLE